MSTQNTAAQPLQPEWLQITEQHVAQLHFGSVQLVVHDSQVVEIVTTERVRFDKGNAKSANHK